MGRFLIIVGLLLTFVGCGQKSTIKSHVKSETMAETYGDGEHVIRSLFLPLSDSRMTYNSPVEKVDFIAGGLARMVLDLGAGMGIGRIKLNMVQPIPEIPTDVIKGVKVKRMFIYLEPKEGQKRWKTILNKVLFGQGDVTFGFLKQLAVKMSSVHLDKFESWIPKFSDPEKLGRKEFTPLQAQFEEEGEVYDPDLGNEKSMIILKYDQAHRDRYLRTNKHGKMYIIQARQPAQTKKYLLKHPQFRNYFKNIHMLNDTLVVELKEDPIVEEGFRLVFADDAKSMDRFKIKNIEPCTEETCLDLQVPDVDLMPILIHENGIRFDAYINSKRAPESFQLKGFAEFEVKMKLTF